MKVIIALAVLVAVAAALPQGRDGDAVVTRYDSDNIGIGGYNYAYDTSNGISAQESGQVNNEGREDESIAVRGQYTYVGDDGVTYTVQYTADENGFQPVGPHIPKA